LSDPSVKGILVNIFGGHHALRHHRRRHCRGAKEVSLGVPLVVRLEGTNVQQGKEILAMSGLPIVAADDLGDAARKIVAQVKNSLIGSGTGEPNEAARRRQASDRFQRQARVKMDGSVSISPMSKCR
jgi:hypothetical protein